MNETLTILLQAVITAAIPVLTAFLVSLIRAKATQTIAQVDNQNAAEYLYQIADAITTAVTATSQTYVDSLKNKGEFTAEAQQEALKKALETAQASLSASALEFIFHAYGDITAYLTAKIEAEVRCQKSATPSTGS